MKGASVCLEMVFEDEPFVDRIDRVADLGFEAVEFWTWPDKDLDTIETRLDERGLALTNMAGIREQAAPEALARAMTDPETRAAAVADVAESLEVATRLGCPFLTTHLGPEQDTSRDRAYESVVSGLREATALAEEAGVTLLLEPLNGAVDHEGYFLERLETAHRLVGDVDSPALGVLFDVYHQQITEGNVISSLRRYREDVEYVHVAAVPGRGEPGTGELNYPNILAALDATGYDGYVGFEFRPESDPEAALERAGDLLA